MMKRTLTIQPYGAVEFFTATLRGCTKERIQYPVISTSSITGLWNFTTTLQGCTIKYDEKNFNNTTLRGCIKEQLLFYSEAVIPLKLL
jgi:hypothetical protein